MRGLQIIDGRNPGMRELGDDGNEEIALAYDNWNHGVFTYGLWGQRFGKFCFAGSGGYFDTSYAYHNGCRTDGGSGGGYICQTA